VNTDNNVTIRVTSAKLPFLLSSRTFDAVVRERRRIGETATETGDSDIDIRTCFTEFRRELFYSPPLDGVSEVVKRIEQVAECSLV
jgi:hypothetical protein